MPEWQIGDGKRKGERGDRHQSDAAISSLRIAAFIFAKNETRNQMSQNMANVLVMVKNGGLEAIEEIIKKNPVLKGKEGFYILLRVIRWRRVIKRQQSCDN